MSKIKQNVAKKMVANPKSKMEEKVPTAPKTTGRNKYYVGSSNEPHKREVFSSKTTPTKESHPQYGHVRSGFKTKKQAESEKNYY